MTEGRREQFLEWVNSLTPEDIVNDSVRGCDLEYVIRAIAEFNLPQYVYQLLDLGLDVHFRTELNGNTILHCVTKHWKHSSAIAVVSELINRGADIHKTARFNRTLIHYAVLASNVQLLHFFVKGGVNVNVKCSSSNYTALDYACLNARWKLIQYLVEDALADLPTSSATLDLTILGYMAYIIPKRVAKCREAVMTLLLLKRSFFSMDRHNVVAIAKIMWKSRRQPVWD